MKSFPLRLEDDMHEAIRRAALQASMDEASTVSMNQWIAEAVEEKLKREEGK